MPVGWEASQGMPFTGKHTQARRPLFWGSPVLGPWPGQRGLSSKKVSTSALGGLVYRPTMEGGSTASGGKASSPEGSEGGAQ